ncbi:MAG: hypothetical protein HZB42_06150 [Sphingobacteriales bacterium]|nr:hypothetical protein [Sphingobacteriales bacterium]
MKTFFAIVMSASLFFFACNNNKGKNDFNPNNREKDDYGKNDNNNGNNKNGWSDAEQRRSMRECLDEVKDDLGEEKGTAYCECALLKAMKKYSSYDEAEKSGTDEEGERIGKECAKELGISITNNGNDRAVWSRTDESRFMRDCEGTARQNVSAQRATEYCDCMLQKVKKIFSSYVEADRGLLQMPKDELDAMVNECNGVEN